MVLSYRYCHFLIFFYPSVFVCKSNTFAGEKTLQLDFCFNRSNRALEFKVNQSIARTVSTAAEQYIKKKGMFIWGNPRLDCLSQNLASLPRTKRKIRKWTLDSVTILDSGFACSGLCIYNVIWRTDNRRKCHWVNRVSSIYWYPRLFFSHLLDVYIGFRQSSLLWPVVDTIVFQFKSKDCWLSFYCLDSGEKFLKE